MTAPWTRILDRGDDRWQTGRKGRRGCFQKTPFWMFQQGVKKNQEKEDISSFFKVWFLKAFDDGLDNML
jgi:hypothetical protein